MKAMSPILFVFALCLGIGTSAVVRASARVDDSTISFWIRTALDEDSRIMPADIAVSVTEGVATLNGTVGNLAERDFAVREAKKIKGVKGVIDEITVRASGRSDEEIRQDVVDALRMSPILRPDTPSVTVDDGSVTLRGQLESWAEREQADLLAREVRGVRSVNDEIEIRWKWSRPDAAIRGDVVAALANDVYLTGLPIEADVVRGIVTLTGEVGTIYQKDRAATAAHVWNVKSVVNRLEIARSDEQGVRERAPNPTDDQLRRAVLATIDQDWRLDDPYRIRVESSNGHVTLRGTVPTYDQKDLAERDADDVVGVTWVSDFISVDPERRTDSAILHDIEGQIADDCVVGGRGIEVHVNGGIVTLSGSVKTTYERERAARIASRILGVKEVVNAIAIDWRNIIRDTDIRERIAKRLQSDAETAWVADRIAVDVENGHVTLSGSVDSWTQRREAQDVAAHADGVTDVTNRIHVWDQPREE
ncbi:MAG: BON domain-containing protein [Planctomycetes bacterium]|nr:BON domain-containing protein [Planctomycetota bacterium]